MYNMFALKLLYTFKRNVKKSVTRVLTSKNKELKKKRKKILARSVFGLRVHQSHVFFLM